MIRTALISVFLLLFLPDVPTIEKDRARWKPAYSEALPNASVTAWHLPFDTANRKDIKELKVISVYGDHRDSYYKGHMHTAIDINPKSPQNKLVSVYAMANGIVCSIHLGDNQKTVVVKHKLSNGKVMFTSYKHLREVYVTTNQQVNEKTKLARLFTPAESKPFGGDYHHLHLEIRKSFDDYGCASWLTMNQQQLEERFYNPLVFLKANL